MDVAPVQQRLLAAGFSPGRIDGDLGKNTYGALFAYVASASSNLTVELGEAAARHFAGAQINTPLRLAHAIARWAVETGGFSVMEENLHYSAKRLTQIWPARFPTLAAALPYAWDASDPDREDIALANLIYGGRGGNQVNGTTDDDGWRYRGRGPTMLTFLDNYKEARALTGINVVTQPDLVATPDIGLSVACAYWGARNLNAAADRDDASAVCRLVQGGQEGLPLQLGYLKRAKKVLLP